MAIESLLRTKSISDLWENNFFREGQSCLTYTAGVRRIRG